MRRYQAAEKKVWTDRNFSPLKNVDGKMSNHRFTSPALAVFAFLMLPLLLSCSDSGNSALQANTTLSAGWATAWNATPENALPISTNPGGQEQSFRFFFYPTVAGTQERVHFSNYFGATAITIGAARLAAAAGGLSVGIDPTRDAPLTFNGSTSVTIQPGQTVTSDSANITYSFGQKMAVSMYVKGTFPPLTQHESQVTENYESVLGAGDTTMDANGASFATGVTEWYLLNGMDVYGSYQGTVVLFGSSSIDGHASNYGSTESYPTSNVAIPSQDNDRPSDWLARQLNTAGYNLSVANAGVLGDPAGENSTTNPATGGVIVPANGVTAGVDRFQRDVLGLSNVKAVVIYLGSVDIRSADCASAPEIETALTNIIGQAHAAGLRVIPATLPPSAYCSNPSAGNYGPYPTAAAPYAGGINPGPQNPGMAQRELVNTWIRTTAVNLPGVTAIADFDKVLADPAHPDFLIPNLNSGDNFHPNGDGYGIQSAAIPLSSLLGQ